MTHESRVLVNNELRTPLLLNIEPEAIEFELACGEEVTVCDSFETSPVTLTVAELEDGTPVISIWPGDGKVRVMKDGVELLDLV
jgi:hypothetical protein